MIIRTLLPIMLSFIFIGIAYTNIHEASKNNINEDISNSVKVEAKADKSEDKSLSLEDQSLIDEYNKIFDYLRNGDEENYHKKLKAFLPKAQLIKNDNERNNVFMNIYIQLGMYKEAYKLNGEMLEKSFSEARLIHQCELAYHAQRPQKEYETCHAKVALAFEKELKIKPKTDPEYIYGEWWYLLSMYKSGHAEYKEKLKKMLDSVKDEQIIFQFESSYELAVQQVESYKKLSHN